MAAFGAAATFRSAVAAPMVGHACLRPPWPSDPDPAAQAWPGGLGPVECAPPDVASTGTLPSGTLQPGTLQPGTLSSGALQPYCLQPGGLHAATHGRFVGYEVPATTVVAFRVGLPWAPASPKPAAVPLAEMTQ